MATQSDVTKTLAKPAAAPKTIQSLIQSAAKELGKALPAHLSADRLVRIALTSIRLNPGLAACTPESFLGSLFVLAQLGLEPVAGRAYLLPFKNNRKVNGEWKAFLEVQALIGYKGYVDLFYRHDKAVLLCWGVVREKDEFDYEKGTAAFLKHKEAKGDRGPVQGYWVMAELKGGGKAFEYMSLDECLAHGRQHSKTFDKKANDGAGEFYKSSPWVLEQDSMCLKTVLIQLAKILPLSIELQRALTVDETSRDYRAGLDDALDSPVTTHWDDEPFVDTTPEKPA